MDTRSTKLKWLIWSTITFISILFTILFIWRNISTSQFESPSPWLVLVHSLGSLFLIILVVWLIFHFYFKLMEILDKQQLDFEKLRQEEKLAETHNQYRIEMEKSELILRLAEKFSTKVESTEKEEKKETKTVTLVFKKELLDYIKDIKMKWDEITG